MIAAPVAYSLCNLNGADSNWDAMCCIVGITLGPRAVGTSTSFGLPFDGTKKASGTSAAFKRSLGVG